MTDHELPEEGTPGWGAMDRVMDDLGRAAGLNPLAHLTDAEIEHGLAEARAGRSPQLRRDPAVDAALERRYGHLTDTEVLARLNALVSHLRKDNHTRGIP